jgi:Flp pilus assembly protein TadG
MKYFSDLRSFLIGIVRNEDGQMSVIFALTLIPVLSGVGAAVDYSRANSVKTVLQASLDSALLAGAKDGTSNWQTVASNVFGANVAAKSATIGTPTFKLQNAVYSGVATASVPTRFMGLISIQTIAVSVKAAVGGSISAGACLISLDAGKSTTDVGMVFNGAPNVNMSGCALRSNTSLACNGHSGGAVASIATGTATGCSNSQSGASVLKDIYASLASNITMACGASYPGATWIPGSPPPPASMKTVSKGSYTEYHICGDLTLSGNGALMGAAPASDAVIFIENGGLNISDGASISTARTTIVLTGDNSRPSSIAFPNGNGKAASLSLSPSTGSSNPWQGISLYQNPSLTNGVDDSWGPGATFNADGVVYLPKANFTTRGNAGSGISQCTVIVTNTFTTNGSINLSFSQSTKGCSDLGVKQYTGSGLYLTQ